VIRVLIADDELPARAKLQRWLCELSDIEVVAQLEQETAPLIVFVTA